ncbi:LysR family transcriptional regulator [Kiloniella spongiae]|uniref:LysR family transcriptional regulator n=1 Tax=Kiloniella spongiae TaxID=1489064 RepID=A0A0H2MY79_9PROT|nr:LysR family transcriptional regulator [Kiloniella spongiae]KLN61675.1 LysR family transcriptional regulator [Kiloniella spongiae]
MNGQNLPPLNWLRAFEASARHLSFTGAARELNMTQSAVSQQIKSLEQSLGLPLFVRQPRVLLLTEAGENYLPIIQDAFERLQSGTLSLTGGDRGQRLTLQCNMSFSVFWLTPRLSRLFDRYPWLTLNVVPELWTNSTEPSASLLIRFGRDVARETDAKLLSQGHFYPVCAPTIAEGVDWHKDRLFDCSGITCSWNAWLGDQKTSLPEGKSINLASTYSISINAAVHGAGLAMGHDVLVQDLMAQGCLVKPFDHEVPMQEAYYLMQPARHSQTPASRAFIEWLEEEFS